MEKREVEGRGVEVGCSLFPEKLFLCCYQKGYRWFKAAKYNCAGECFFAFQGLMGGGNFIGLLRLYLRGLKPPISLLIEHTDTVKVFL